MFSVFKERRRLASIKAERQREREREREKGTLDTFAEASLTAGRGGGRSDNTVEIAGSSERRGWRLRMLVVAGAAGGEAASQVFANVARSSRGMGVCYGLR